MWIKNTSGKKDAMLTFALIAFMVTTANVLLSTIGSFSAGDFQISFEALDAAIMSTYLGIAFSAYVGRRWTDKKYVDELGLPSDLQEPHYDEVEQEEHYSQGEEPPEPPPSLL
jgi:hypothetical protein